MEKQKAIVITNGMLDTMLAKTAHGLLRGTARFDILALIDYKHAGRDAGEVMDGRHRNVPVFASVSDYFANGGEQPAWCIIGVALPGGKLPDDFRGELKIAMQHKCSIVCGLHTFLSEEPEFIQLAAQHGVQLFDVRKPRPRTELKFWSGDIYKVKIPRIAVLGTDCAIGKRTTCRFLMEMCQRNSIYAEMIYTGQTGWMQGYRHGFIFDSTVNDFIGGEVERVIVECAEQSKPDLILIEGQSALRNPSGPCGAEFLLSGNTKDVILHHAPGREFYEGTEAIEFRILPIESEIELIKMYGAEVIAVTLNNENKTTAELKTYRDELQQKLGIPVVLPLEEGVDGLLPVVQDFMKRSSN
jgi:uncharacterized NAD-dependent epimerase/dehydratase family protein